MGIFTFDWGPNDTLYPQQTSLHTSSVFPDAHINVEAAWTNHSETGKSFVRVGVFDTGIWPYTNVDIAHMTEMYNFVNSYSQIAFDNDGHGSAMAGIIGSRSHNTVGIAGVAGGGITDTIGATIVTMKIETVNFIAMDSWIKNGYIAGASGTNVLLMATATGTCMGKALHIMNNSYSKKNEQYNPEMVEGINFVNQNGVVFVASRANYKTSTPQFSINTYAAPGTLKPNIIMTVGASGTDGHYHLEGVNGAQFTSMRGKGVDFLAPGDSMNILAPYAFQPANQSKPGPGINTYTSYAGTSSSAAFVSGVTALMMSFRNQPQPFWDNIVHEDCEALLKRTATDLASGTYFEAAGNDSVSGYGRINADSALSALEAQYKIRHIDATHHSTSVFTSTSIVASGVTKYIPQTAILAPGLYNVDLIEYQYNYSYPFGGETFLDAWPLYKASVGYPAGTSTLVLDEPHHAEIISVSSTSALLKNYQIKVNFKVSNSQPINMIFGSNPKAAFTLYSLGEATSGIKKNNEEERLIKVFPNPSTGNYTVLYMTDKDEDGVLLVMDITGRILLKNDFHADEGRNRRALDLLHLPNGVYFLTLDIMGRKRLTRKLILSR